jgi:hypothetical protein
MNKLLPWETTRNWVVFSCVFGVALLLFDGLSPEILQTFSVQREILRQLSTASHKQQTSFDTWLRVHLEAGWAIACVLLPQAIFHVQRVLFSVALISYSCVSFPAIREVVYPLVRFCGLGFLLLGHSAEPSPPDDFFEELSDLPGYHLKT